MLLLGLAAPLGHLYELLVPLAVSAIAVSFLFSIYLYSRSFWAPSHALALGGNTGEELLFVIKNIYQNENVVIKKAAVGVAVYLNALEAAGF